VDNPLNTLRSPKAQSISRRFSYAFIGVVTVMLFAFAAIAVFANYARINTEIKNRLDHALKLAQIALPTPLWNLDNDVAQDFVQAMFLDDSLVYVKVLWGKQVITERTRSKYKQKDFAYFQQSPDFLSRSEDIVFQGNKVGTVQLVMSRESVKKNVFYQISGIVALTLLIIVAISLTSMLITRRYISRPLSKLQGSASAIAQGDLETFIDKGSNDEIGMLARDLDVMRGSIKEAKENLEQKVEERTQDLTETLEQQTATSDVLRVISSSPTDVQPVFDMIARSARRLCNGEFSVVFRFDGKLIDVVSHDGLTPEAVAAYRQMYPRTPSREYAIGRVILTQAMVHIPDIEADSGYVGSGSRTLGVRSIVAVPMLREGGPIGGIGVMRAKVGAFAENQTELLKTFADQAVIAIENVRLFQELKARTQELTRSVGELKALGEIGQAISSTLDLETVLQTIVTRAVELSKTDAGTIYEFDENEQVFVPRANYGLTPEVIEALRAARVRVGDNTGMGEAARTRTSVQIADLMSAPHYALPQLQEAGFRALLALPLLRENHIVGGLVVRRKTPGEFPAAVVDLVQTFAAQSAVAIHNARLFQEIQDKSRQLEIASQHKSQFLANMSHELRTPLNAIIGFSEVLLERMFGDLNEKQTEYLNDIFTSGKHLLNLINDILDLSKIEAGKMELEPSTFNLRQLLEGSLTVVKERAHAHGITLSLDIAADLDAIIADERKVKQVVFNLLSNAVKFTPDKGKVGIRARKVPDAVEVSVWDTGIGIAPEDQRRVFEEFQQAGQTLTNKPEGTGLGLTLTRKFVELHGGTMRLESAPGKGSTFTFTLPATSQAQAALPLSEPEGKAVVSPAAQDAATGPLVLIIEDDPKAIDLLSIYLREAGYTVETARDGEEGLEKAKRLSPHAIILDVLLPKLGGWDFLTKIKADTDTMNTPVIITSIVDQKGKGFALGAADYLVKPFKKKTLLKSLSTFGLVAKTAAGPAKILAIDDDPKAIELLATALEPEGFQVLRSYGGEEGIRMAEIEHPDMIILDLLMPGVNGFEVLDRLEKTATPNKPPVLIFTVKDLTRAEKEQLSGRVARLAQKQEYSPQHLVGMVRQLLKRA
jgi:signal transduction histidine kinase/DNA-binding response OmpR family regulator/HAMP domain-containing protein